MHPFYLEIELIKPVSDFFKSEGYKVFREIRIGFCRADLVAFKNGKVTAVELKLSDRKKAFVQAKNYQLAADFVYFAFPLQKVYSLLRKCEHTLKKEGIGLLSVNEKDCTVSKIIKAQQSKRKISTLTIQQITKNRFSRKSKFKVY